MTAFANLHIRYVFTSLSPAVPNPSVGFNYFASSTSQDITDVQNLVSQISTIFNTVQSGQGQAACSYMSQVLSRATNMTTIDVYDVTNVLSGGKMGSPVLISSMTLGATTATTAAASQLAAVCTLQAPYGTDVEFGPGTRPRARDRGRIFFGPLTETSLSLEATTNRAIINPNVRTDLTVWLKALHVLTTTPHSVAYNLSVWSRKNGIMKSLQEVWVDDRPDQQRRRAGLAVGKTVLATP